MTAKLKYKNDGYFYLKCDFETRKEAREAGFKWNRSKKLWYTDCIFTASKLARYADHETARSLEKRLHFFERSSATESDLIVPAPPGLTYDPHQLAAIEWAVGNRTCLIADEQGLGKTIEAIGAANYLYAAKILIVTIASMKYTWAEELEKWSTMFPQVGVVEGSKPVVSPHATALVVNYDIVRYPDVQDLIRQFAPYDLMILDEVHYLQNPQAQRTKALIGPEALAAIAKRHILLTGTPMQSKPINLYPLVAAFARHLIKPYDTYWAFAKKFNGAYKDKWGWQLGNATCKEELNQRLRQGFMLRRLKKDVMKNLPDKRYQIVPLTIDAKTGKIAKQMEKLSQQHDLTEIQMQKIDLGLNFDAHEKDMAALGEMVNLRRDLAEAKLPACVRHIKDLLGGGTQKLIVFAHHKDVVGRIAEELRNYKPLTVTGATTNKRRKAAVDTFQNDPEYRVFIGNMDAAGTGITLTAASTVVCVEWSWVPGVIEQAVDRAHRRGQTEMVLAQFLVVKDTIEEYMMRRVIEKLRNIKQIVEKKDD